MNIKTLIHDISFCTCDSVESVHGECNDWGTWLVCDKCNLPLEDSFECTNPAYLDFDE